MKYARIRLLLACLAMLLMGAGCTKEDKNPTPQQTAPTNLVVTATPATDGSGKVAFTATATNAVSYDYEFGNGAIATATTGSTNYQYTLVGTNTFTVTVTAKSSNGLTLKKSIPVTVTVTVVAPTLLFAEEFNTDGVPNTAKWGYDLGGGGWGNNELQYYTSRPENVVVLNGMLKITLIKEAYNGAAYTSARLLSKDKFDFKYGRIEVRAKLPVGGGTWPAIWMLGSNLNTVPWPACGEIDIMEHVGNQQNKIFGTLHHPGHSGGNADGGSIIIPDASTAFHNYIVEWSAASIKFYVDTQLFYTFPNNATLPFNHNFFVILNMAMGGNFGGAVDPAFTSASMEVDYVRVYQ